MTWENVTKDDRWPTLPRETQEKVAENYFQKNIAADPRYGTLSPEAQAKTRENFMQTLGPKPVGAMDRFQAAAKALVSPNPEVRPGGGLPALPGQDAPVPQPTEMAGFARPAAPTPEVPTKPTPASAVGKHDLVSRGTIMPGFTDPQAAEFAKIVTQPIVRAPIETAGTGALLLGGVSINPKTKDALFKFYDETRDLTSKLHPDSDAPFVGKFLDGVLSIVPYMATGGAGAASILANSAAQGAEAVKQGVDEKTATAIAVKDLATSAAMLAMGGKFGVSPLLASGKDFAAGATKGAGINMGLDILDKALEKGILTAADYHEAASKVKMVDPESLGQAAGIGAMFGISDTLGYQKIPDGTRFRDWFGKLDQTNKQRVADTYKSIRSQGHTDADIARNMGGAFNLFQRVVKEKADVVQPEPPKQIGERPSEPAKPTTKTPKEPTPPQAPAAPVEPVKTAPVTLGQNAPQETTLDDYSKRPTRATDGLSFAQWQEQIQKEVQAGGKRVNAMAKQDQAAAGDYGQQTIIPPVPLTQEKQKAPEKASTISTPVSTEKQPVAPANLEKVVEVPRGNGTPAPVTGAEIPPTAVASPGPDQPAATAPYKPTAKALEVRNRLVQEERRQTENAQARLDFQKNLETEHGDEYQKWLTENADTYPKDDLPLSVEAWYHKIKKPEMEKAADEGPVAGVEKEAAPELPKAAEEIIADLPDRFLSPKGSAIKTRLVSARVPLPRQAASPETKDVVYHGTNKPLSEIRANSYFGTKDEAAMWAMTRAKKEGGEPRVYAVSKSEVEASAAEVMPEGAYRSGKSHIGEDVTDKVMAAGTSKGALPQPEVKETPGTVTPPVETPRAAGPYEADIYPEKAYTGLGPEDLTLPIEGIGSRAIVMKAPSIVVDTQRINGVDYDLYKADSGEGIIRSMDADSGNVVELRKFPKFEDAKKYHDDTIAKSKPDHIGDANEKVAEPTVKESLTTAPEKPQSADQRLLAKARAKSAQSEKPATIEPEKEGGTQDESADRRPAEGDGEKGAQVAKPEDVPRPDAEGTTPDISVGDRSERAGDLRSEPVGGQEPDTQGRPEEEPVRRGKRSRSGKDGDSRDRLEPVDRLSGSSDFRVQPGDLRRDGSWRATADRNLDIVELVKRLEAEKRQATPEEQKLLAKFTGWGASEIANKLFPGYAQRGEIIPGWAEEAWKPLVERAQRLFTPEELKTAARSTQYAHYTSEGVIRGIYSALERFGFKGGKILDPGAGVSHFAGLIPESMYPSTRYTGIEMDSLSAAIAKQLYPNQNVLHADFIKQNLPESFFDAGVGNPPFSSSPILSDPRYKKYGFSLHDYFFAKSLDKIRPGGLMVFVTSRYTMDKQGDKARKYLSDRADLLGAIRLPQTAFEKNAGTEVVTDVLFFRKRAEGEPAGGVSWSKLTEVKTPEGPALINEYYAEHPDMVLGKNSLQGTMYKAKDYTVLPIPGDIEEHFMKAVEKLPAGVYSNAMATPATQQAAVIERDFNPKAKKEGNLYVSEKGDLMVVDQGVGVSAGTVRKGMGLKDVDWLKGYVGLRDLVKQAQYDQLIEGDWQKSLKEMNRGYDAFVKKHGRILDFSTMERRSADEDGNEVVTEYRRFKNAKLLRADVESSLIEALERIREDGSIVKAPFLTERTIKKPEPREVRSIYDALAVTLDEKGKLSIPDIAERMNVSEDEAVEGLGDLVFQNPSGAGKWELADEYLSGNVVEKLEQAQAAAAVDKKYQRNVEALKAVQPAPLGPDKITVNLGASWVPQEDVATFAGEVLGIGSDVTYNSTAGMWSVARTQRRGVARAKTSEWGTSDRSPDEILDSVLNNRQLKVTRTERTPEGTKSWTDEEATTKINDIAKKMKERFRSWVWEDAGRAKNLLDIYNRTQNNLAGRRFDGSHLTLPGASLRFKLHDHQKRGIWRIIQSGNTYLAHSVGAGKTFIQIAAGMEMKRMGLIRKSVYSVPNHMLEQFSGEFQELYPMANIMVADEENFHTDNRRRFIAQAALNKPDAIIITHSALGLISVKSENVNAIREQFLDDLREQLSTLEEDRQTNRIFIKQVEKRIEDMERRFDTIVGGKKDQNINFEDLDADFLFLDEAHEFRKLDFVTNRKVKGVDPSGSRKAMDLYIKTKWLERQRPGRSHVFASGTPITNTMGELFNLMRFFDEGEMDKKGIGSFDMWANNYGDVHTDYERNAAGKYEQVERFARFTNVPELMKAVRQFMDVLTSSQLSGYVKRPDIVGKQPKMVMSEAPQALKDYMKNVLMPRIEASKKWKPSKDEPGNPDPIINIITDGRLAAIDMRYVDPRAKNDPNSKLNKMADGIVETYQRTKNLEYTDVLTEKSEPIKGGAQIVFYNVGFGQAVMARRGFDAKAWLSKRLKDGGIPTSEIAWIEDYGTAAKKEGLYREMRQGKKKVLIGSSKKMGTGLNVQKRLFALHYLDAPWYPADVEQPQGRIIRQGNQNGAVELNWYATKETYDSTMWQMVSRKGKFIEMAFEGDDSIRNLDDISESSLYAQAAALASGDQRVIQVVGLQNDIARLGKLKAAHKTEQIDLNDKLRRHESDIKWKNQRIAELSAAEKKAPEYIRDIDGTVDGKKYDSREEFGKALIDKAKVKPADGERHKIGEMNGFPVLSEWSAATMRDASEGKTGTPVLRLELTANEHASAFIEDSTSAKGIVTQFVNAINSIGDKKDTVEREVSELKADIERINRRMGAPFEYEQEMGDKTAELAQLQNELATEGKEKGTAKQPEVEGEKPKEADERPVARAREESSIEDIRASRRAEKEAGRKGKGQIGAVNRSVVAKYYESKNKDFEEGIAAQKEGVKPGAMFQKLYGLSKDFLSGFTRIYKALPYDQQFAEANKIFTRMRTDAAKAKELAQVDVEDVMGDHNHADADLFIKRLVLNDAKETFRLARARGESVELPFGITEGNVDTLIIENDGVLTAHPEVKADLGVYYKINEDRVRRYTAAFDAIGMKDMGKKLKNERYFHHMVMAYAQEGKKRAGTGKSDLVKKLVRGYLKKRSGGTSPYNTNAAQVMYFTVANMERDIMWAKNTKEMLDRYDQMPKLKAELKKWRQKALRGLTWRIDFIGSPTADKVKRLFDIGSEMGELIEAGEVKESELIRLRNERRDLLRDIQSDISNYRGMLESDPNFRQSEEERVIEWYADKKDLDDSDEEIAGIDRAELLASVSRNLTDFQVAMIGNEIKAHTLAKKLLGDGFRPFAVKDIFYYSKGLGEDMINDALENSLGEVVGKDVLKDILVRADQEIAVLPVEILDTYSNIAAQIKAGKTVPRQIWDTAGLALRKWYLFAPHKFPMYFTGNLVSDTSFLAGVVPGALRPKYSGRAYQIMLNAVRRKPISYASAQEKADVTGFFARGGEQAGYGGYEIGDIQEAPRLKGYNKGGLAQAVTGLPGTWFKSEFDVNSVSEGGRRLAAYLYILDRLRAGDENYYSSKREVVDGLESLEDKAFLMANDVLVNYNQTSETGRGLKNALFFYSFREGSAKRFFQTARNIVIDEKEAEAVAGRLAAHIGMAGARITGKAALRFAQTAILLGMVQALTTVWNILVAPDEEDGLNEFIRSKPHLIIPKSLRRAMGEPDPERTIYLTTYDAMTEALSWIGLSNWYELSTNMKEGNYMTVLKDVALAPVNTVYGLLTPLIKAPGEIMMKKSLYPKVQRPRIIRDRGEAAARALGLDAEYRAATGMPGRGYLRERLGGIALRTAETGEAAYWNIREAVGDWKEKQGKDRGEFTPTDKDNALYYYKQAIKVGDEKAARKYMKEYVKEGGTVFGAANSIMTSKPLGSLPIIEQGLFKNTMTEEQKRELRLAEDWYTRTFQKKRLNVKDFTDAKKELEREGVKIKKPILPTRPNLIIR